MMKERMDISKAEPGIYRAMAASDRQVEGFELDAKAKGTDQDQGVANKRLWLLH
jgi:hypothetical protein